MADENLIRRSFLFIGIALTLFGCILAALAIALPAWQVVELLEFNALHEHGIFYDCVRSDVIPLKQVRLNSNSAKASSASLSTAQLKRCSSKFDETATWSMRMAIEEGDPVAREQLFHRFLPQHKAVLFFFIFSVIFSLISVLVGSCSACFVPNGVLHVVSVAMAMSCSVLASSIFWVAAHRPENQLIRGTEGSVYRQELSYAFILHVAGSAMLVAATLCSIGAAYLLLRRECRLHGCLGYRHGKGASRRATHVGYKAFPTACGVESNFGGSQCYLPSSSNSFYALPQCMMESPRPLPSLGEGCFDARLDHLVNNGSGSRLLRSPPRPARPSSKFGSKRSASQRGQIQVSIPLAELGRRRHSSTVTSIYDGLRSERFYYGPTAARPTKKHGREHEINEL